jgi:hypothetical protein
MSKHYPNGYSPQTYGERDIADRMTTEQIQKAINDKKAMKQNNPQEYDKQYRGTSGKTSGGSEQ